MEENVRKELDTLKGMVLNWKKNYLGWASPDGGNEYLLQEFMEEIDRHVTPFVERLNACEHLDTSEANEFLDYCYGQVHELRDQLLEAEAKHLEKASVSKLVEYSSYGWRK